MLKRNARRVPLFLLIVMMVLLAACSENSAVPSQSDRSADEGEGAQSSGTDSELHIALTFDMDTPDTHNSTSVSTESIMVNVLDYLLRRDNAGSLQPHLVETYENVDDTTWSFRLKEGITFHNGDPMTAEDIKFSLERVATDDMLQQHVHYKSIKEVRVIDDYNFDIITHEPDPALPYRIAREGSGIFPKSYIEEAGWDEFLKKPIGSGPYRFVEWRKDDRVILEKYDRYFNGDVSEWDTVVFRTIPEASTRIGELLTGGIDVASSVPVTDWDRIQNHDGTSAIEAETTVMSMIMVNQNEAFATSDPKVREAIDYAIDNQALADKFTNGLAVPSRTRVIPGVLGFEESLHNTYRYDPERARELLQEAGYNDDLEISFGTMQGTSIYSNSEMAQLIAGMLEAVGIKVNLEVHERSQYVDVRNTGKNKELLLVGWNNLLFDASLAVDHFRSDYNPAGFGYSNPRVDELIEKARVNMNAEERAEQYQEIQRIVAEELPYIYVYQFKDIMGINDALDYEPRVDQMFYVEEIKRK
ncbi:peptide ABC transporter substrate-binding protein [Xylanibacillus composti]|uniref:Peptide ABC transporter substrate-binding protein n=1 Tax=Xylanibacillus composti TaxID=1572762 RepID=A0A8J4H6N1_9BACL|nr:ABC transporter substrate-binding protein [Xylanibacillus composti]GIQ69683.1 peptide ABC transporter substrate-binding protein [Xylanibacillus composti]